MDELDRIEKQIDIDAPAAKVWALISEPGWFINDNQIVEHRIERDGDLDIVHDPVHGAFAIRTVTLDEPHYAAFRWVADPTAPDAASTLVEFFVEETSPSAVVLRVVESGFASLPGTDAERRKHFDGNTEGWNVELALAKRHLEGVAAREG
ncbi:ATPase [Georgenia thermotolerans]|uniref:ATPase n=1 Tax=Georgenia thermotolerans TaxID=527326 RepID=A0A7J5UUZ9_9MICO|nr:ATPase [Georgenia thermotolerans]KAE8766119.1 ATPase [Georgenia thermotolerans]